MTSGKCDFLNMFPCYSLWPHSISLSSAFPGGSDSRESACQCRRPGFDLWAGKIPWRRKWQPTPVFLPGEFNGQRSLVGYSPWGHRESDTTKWQTLSLCFSFIKCSFPHDSFPSLILLFLSLFKLCFTTYSLVISSFVILTIIHFRHPSFTQVTCQTCPSNLLPSIQNNNKWYPCLAHKETDAWRG